MEVAVDTRWRSRQLRAFRRQSPSQQPGQTAASESVRLLRGNHGSTVGGSRVIPTAALKPRAGMRFHARMVKILVERVVPETTYDVR